MITLEFRFPAGRYHATPWGHHVNEGLVEWPPSPWRILRSLVAVGYTTEGWSEVPPDGRLLVETLASVPPRYQLPMAVTGHSRHYMPIAQLDGAREKTTLVVDAWAQIPKDGRLGVRWNVELPAPWQTLFERLVAAWGYLGRSESWVEARIVGDDSLWPEKSEVAPATHATPHRPGWEQVSLLAPVTAADYAAWVQQQREMTRESTPAKPSKGKKAGVDPYPADLLACLQTDQSWLYEQGWSQPPGAQRVLYWAPSDRLEIGAPPSMGRTGVAPAVETILLAMAYPGGNKSPLPPVARTLPQGELLHRRLVGTAMKMGLGPLSVLTGTDDDKSPLNLGHRHAHVLHLDLDGDEHLDHVLVWAPMGLDESCQRTIRSVRGTAAKHVGDLDLAWVGAGSVTELRQLRGKLGDGLVRVVGPQSGAVEWVSATPFVPARFLKKNGKNGLRGQIDAECESRGLPTPTELEVIDFHSVEAAPLRHHIRVRRNGPRPPVDAGFVLRLKFAQPVCGPITLGYGSHFGLGLFYAVPA